MAKWDVDVGSRRKSIHGVFGRLMARIAKRRVTAALAAIVCWQSLGASLASQSPNKTQDLKKAEREIQQGEKAEKAGKLDEALALYDAAAIDAPMNVDIVGHAAALRGKMVRAHVDAAENAAIRGDLRKATDELHTALKIDPGNTVLAEREAQMKSMSAEVDWPTGPTEEYKLQGPPTLKPLAGKKNFDMRGDTRGAYESVARAFGIAVAFDPDLLSRNVKFRVDRVDFETAMRILGQQTT